MAYVSMPFRMETHFFYLPIEVICLFIENKFTKFKISVGLLYDLSL